MCFNLHTDGLRGGAVQGDALAWRCRDMMMALERVLSLLRLASKPYRLPKTAVFHGTVRLPACQ